MFSRNSFFAIFNRMKLSSSPKRILLLASLRPGCGNTATAQRLTHQLRLSTKYFVDCISVDQPHTESDSFAALIRQYDAIVALHVYRAGQLLTSIYQEHRHDLPLLILIFAGTELHSCEPKWMPIIESILPHAKGLVCFNAEWKEYVETTYKHYLPCSVTVIPQSVLQSPTNVEPLAIPQSLIDDQRKRILWIGEIRPVKDPLFLLRFLSYLNSDHYHLVLIGYGTDRSLTEYFRCSSSPSSSPTNFTWLDGQSQDFVHAMMRTSVAYINTSINEGMCLAILEAMTFGLPVLARRNTGNTSIVKHGQTGLIFDTPEQAAKQLHQLDQNPQLRQKLIQRAGQYVKKSHHLVAETKAYQKLLNDLF